jgi:4-alpha-glucanotransferase
MRERRAGLLLHPTSFPGPYGIGDLGPEAAEVLDWAAGAGFSLWQVLPLGPTGPGHSPYGSPSAFAGNPLLVSPQRLADDGLLPRRLLGDVPPFPTDEVDFPRVIAWKEGVLRASWGHVRERPPAGLEEELRGFAAAPEQQPWLEDWALFCAIKEASGGRPWTEWPAPIARRQPEALADARRELAEEIAYHRYLQLLFARQWGEVRSQARRLGIRILGDLPMYVALDGADVWAHPELFRLDAAGRPTEVAGVPPDYFSATGQRWGNPLYRWDRMEADGFAWWIARVRANLGLADLLRLDHFRGFAGYWEIAAGEPTAAAGHWVQGPGVRFFAALREALGELPLIAEDLGEITPEVRELRSRLGLPGMKVLQFAFGEADSEHAPHRHDPGTVAYTGTHDNDTAAGWFASVSGAERGRFLAYFGEGGEPAARKLVRAAFTSVADLAVVPLQDLLGLGSEARMNTPGGGEGNWRWRARREHFTAELAAWVRRLGELTGRTRPA